MATDDLLTLAEAKMYVSVGSNDAVKDDLLRNWITGASRALVSKVGTIIHGSVTAELHSGGRPYVYLDHAPVKTVSLVVEYDGTTASTLTAESNSSKPDTAYHVELTSGRVRRRNGNADAWFPVGVDNVLVTYVAGRFSATSTVGAEFKDACGLVLKNAWQAYESTVGQIGEFDVPQARFPRFVIPNAVKEMLGGEWQYGSGTGD